MNPPTRSIRVELNDALVGGIRERGPNAFGMLLEALVRLLIGVIAFAVLFVLSKVAGYEAQALAPFAGMTAVSALVSLLVTWHPKAGSDPLRGDEAGTHDTHA